MVRIGFGFAFVVAVVVVDLVTGSRLEGSILELSELRAVLLRWWKGLVLPIVDGGMGVVDL